MLNTLVFEDTIIIFWDRVHLKKDAQYKLVLNEETIGFTQKTHYTFENLTPLTKYQIKVFIEFLDKCEEVGSLCVKTGAEKRRIDITQEPYSAVGDGKTLNTAAIQKAIDMAKEKDM